jgi:hypothetical protein
LFVIDNGYISDIIYPIYEKSMFYNVISNIYHSMVAEGLGVRSERHFSEAWLGMRPTYFNDYRTKGRDMGDVPDRVAGTLRGRLAEVARWSPSRRRAELLRLVDELDEAADMAKALRRPR